MNVCFDFTLDDALAHSCPMQVEPPAMKQEVLCRLVFVACRALGSVDLTRSYPPQVGIQPYVAGPDLCDD